MPPEEVIAWPRLPAGKVVKRKEDETLSAGVYAPESSNHQSSGLAASKWLESDVTLPSELRDELKEAAAAGEITQEDSSQMWEDLLPALRIQAYTDFNTFAELVGVDDDTGEPIRQARIHKEWAVLCERYRRLLIWSHINSAKTTQLSVLRTVWELGKDSTLRFAILSNTKGQAETICRAIAALIDRNPEVRAIFPNLKPDPAGPWTNTRLRVVRPGNAKDPSVRAVGVHGDLTGGRVDRLIIDDILDPENCDTDVNRRKLSAWYKAVAVGRLTRRAKVLVVGTAYHPKDLLHELAAQKGWMWFRFPVVSAKGLISWPELWTPERILDMRTELGPAEYARQMLCKARDDDEARFKQEWIDLALAAGDGMPMIARLDEIPDGCGVFTGVDVGVKKTKRADKTAFFTFLEDSKGNRRLLNITAGKFTGPEILRIIGDLYSRYQSIFIVENVAAQDFILQFLKEGSNIPVLPHTTTSAKRDPTLGVEGLAIELANGKWIFPNKGGQVDPELEIFITELLFYSPSAHTGDRLMACYFARDKARVLMRHDEKAVPGVSVHVVGQSVEEVQATSGGTSLDIGFAAMDN